MTQDRAFYSPSPWSSRFHQASADEVLGGGSAGPGKSLTLLFDPLQSQAVVEHARMTQQIPEGFPDWLADLVKKHPIRPGESEGHALHLRRTTVQIKETIDRSTRMFPKFDSGAVYSKADHQWTFTSGYKYTFGHCKEENGFEDYLSKQYCVVRGTGIAMGDGSLKAIEDVQVGDEVMTLEGPKRVTGAHYTGTKHCVAATIEYRGEIVGTQLHPTTHPVLLWPTAESLCSPSWDRTDSALPIRRFGAEWLDFESLLDGLPKSPVRRVSQVGEDTCFATSDGERLELRLLPLLMIPVTLSEHVLRKRGLLALDDVVDVQTGSGTATSSSTSCPPSDCSHGGPPRYPSDTRRSHALPLADAEEPSRDAKPGAPGGAPTHTQTNHAWSYGHFYTGESRPLTEGVRRGECLLRYHGRLQTFDLTVEGANHYITEHGLINCNTWLGFDEAYQFTERQYEEIDARVRSGDAVLRHLKRTRLMSNPAPGWLKERFVSLDPKGHVVFKFKVTDPETGEVEWKTRLFLPARLDDNPDKAFVRDYKFKLLQKPKHMRARYLYGDWDSVEGGFFEEDWNPAIHVIEQFKIPREWPKFRMMDWGYKSQGVILWGALDSDENLYIFYEFNFRMMKDEECALRVQDIEKKFGFWNDREKKSRLIGVADTQLWEERGDSGRSKAAAFHAKGVYWQPADKASITRNAERIVERLRDYDKDRPPGIMVFDNCRKTQQMFSSIRVDENDSTIPDKKSDLKHWFDALAYGCARASRGRGSIPMAMHEYDLRDRDDDEELPRAAGGSFGY